MKKIFVLSILIIIMLVSITFASAVDTNTTNIEKKESPLYGLRTRRAITEKINVIIENIKTKFLGERIFLLPSQWLKNGEQQTIRVTMFCKTFPVSTCSATSVPECCQLVRQETEKGFASCYGGTCYPTRCYTCKC